MATSSVKTVWFASALLGVYPVLMQANLLQDWVCSPCDMTTLHQCEANFNEADILHHKVLADKDAEIARLNNLLEEKTRALNTLKNNEVVWLREKAALKAQVAEAQGYTEALRRGVYSVCDRLMVLMNKGQNDYEEGDEDLGPETQEARDFLRITPSDLI